MKFQDVPVGARIGELAARIDELAKAAFGSPGTISNVAPPEGSAQGALGWTARQLGSALEDVRALLGDGVVNSLIAALPETVSAALRDLPAELTTGQIQAILDRLFSFQHAFEGIEETEANEAAARQTIAEVNRAMQAVWPEIPADLVLRGPDGEGRGRLAIKEFKDLVTPGGPGALTFEKLERRISGASSAAPRLAAEQSLRLNQVTIPSSNLVRSIEFYRGLGLRLIVRDDSVGYARLLLPDGGSTFSVHVADAPISPSQVVIYFECDDLDDRVTRLRAAGYAFSSMPEDQTWLWREARIEDPDGQPLCLYYAGVNRKDPPWRLADAPPR
jgi:catechol 2,3-dioxygenase-like lactoylglutathione lyase family enzyme